MCPAFLTVLLSLTFSPPPAETGDDAVAAAQDAFGVSVGAEQLGLYSASAVRGFSPVDAGNLRLEGLYIDRQASFTGRSVAGHTIRVGLSAAGFPFAAPTGVVDYRLRRAGARPSLTASARASSFGASLIEIDASLPAERNRPGLAAGLGLYWNQDHYDRKETVTTFALTPEWRISDSLTVTPFWTRSENDGLTAMPVVMTEPGVAPPVLPRRHFFGQPWTGGRSTHDNAGAIVDADMGGWALRAGAFHSESRVGRSFSDLFLDTSPDGMGNRLVIANPPQRYGSLSGEARLSRELAEGPRRHVFHVSARGRGQERRYGGGDRIELGPWRVGSQDAAEEPEFQFGERSRDSVRQWSAGLGYEGRWTGIGALSAGLQRVDYQKRSATPAGARPDADSELWLPNAALAIAAGSRVTAYAGYSRGLEESPVSPESAANRDEAPPAIETRQVEAGVSWRPRGGVQIVAGVFEIEKPYFDLDGDRMFRRLGQTRHRGIELSARAEPVSGLTVIAGAVWLDAEVTGEQVEAGALGERPAGIPDAIMIFNADYRPAFFDRLSADLAVEHHGARAADRLNLGGIGPRTVVDAGLRYRLSAAGRPVVLRLTAQNVFNEYSLNTSGSGAYTFIPPRRLYARLTASF